jgi:hypothetical protein
LFHGVHALQAGTQLGGDVFGGFTGAFAEVTAFVTVAQLYSFVLARGCAGRDSSAPHASVRQIYIRFNSRVAARIEDLSTNYLYDFHWFSSLLGCGVVKS